MGKTRFLPKFFFTLWGNIFLVSCKISICKHISSYQKLMYSPTADTCHSTNSNLLKTIQQYSAILSLWWHNSIVSKVGKRCRSIKSSLKLALYWSIINWFFRILGQCKLLLAISWRGSIIHRNNRPRLKIFINCQLTTKQLDGRPSQSMKAFSFTFWIIVRRIYLNILSV